LLIRFFSSKEKNALSGNLVAATTNLPNVEILSLGACFGFWISRSEILIIMICFCAE